MAGKCLVCGSESKLISSALNVCVECLRSKPSEALRVAMKMHYKSRARIRLPPQPPREGGYSCKLCVNECSPAAGERSYCGLWTKSGSRLQPRQDAGYIAVYTYLDPHPTNCVAAHLCPATTSRGYPRYTRTEGVEWGYSNLAVFAYGCTLDCLFCQNYEHKTSMATDSWRIHTRRLEDLVFEAMDDRVTCICYFGGDPTPQMPWILRASRLMLEYSRERGVVKRICWETNGLQAPGVMREMARLSLESGGIVKIDWKAWTPSVYQALTGVDGVKAVERLKTNARLVTSMARDRPEIPLLVVSILLVPGYVDPEEVSGIAGYLSTLDPPPPVVLLAFHPDYLMNDLPPTSRHHMEEAVRIVRKSGIREVYKGNVWLLGDYYRVQS